jgi:hypothetical protein
MRRHVTTSGILLPRRHVPGTLRDRPSFKDPGLEYKDENARSGIILWPYITTP